MTSHESTNQSDFFFLAPWLELKGSALSIKTAPRPSYFKGCTQVHTNNAFLQVNRNYNLNINQSIEQDGERLQCLMLIYNRSNVSASA